MSFLRKYQELKQSIPVPALVVSNNENCESVDYCNQCKHCANCILCLRLENGIYCEQCGIGRDLVDCYNAVYCELCYQSTDCFQCWGSTYLVNCSNCRDCHFCNQCSSCTNCFGCVALTNKQFCILNKQYSEKEYRKKIEHMRREKPGEIMKNVASLIHNIPQPQSNQRNNENCPYGDYINNSKNVYWAFNTYWLEESGYVFDGGLARNCWDMTFGGGGGGEKIMEGKTELCYEVVGGGGNYQCAFVERCVSCTNCTYGSLLRNCSDCFGCVALTHKQYCILNNQLTKDAYNQAVRSIKKELGWGE